MSFEQTLDRQLFFLKQRWFYVISFLLLDNMTAARLRAALLRQFGARVGRNCVVRGGLQIQEGFNLFLGDNVFVNAGCCFDSSSDIRIGNNVQISFQVTLITGGHQIGTHASRAGMHAPAPISIGDGVWIGARSIVLPGVTIGEGAVVGAGALVTRDVAPDSVVAGVPAKLVRMLDDGENTLGFRP